MSNPNISADPLASWNDGPVKQSILSFVEKVTKAGSPDFVPVPERIAVFDNDGTLWSEQPVPVQFYFALDRLRTLAPQNPEWETREPFASLLKGDLSTTLAGGGIEFMRPWAEPVYGIPPQQIVGSSIKTTYEFRNGKAVLVRLPELNFNNDKGGKPVSIARHIGRRPIMAFGNSDGDQQMLEYTQSGSCARIAGCQARRIHASAR